MPATLTAANAEEIHDLITWLDDHPADVSSQWRDATAHWLMVFVENTDAFPAFIAVPEELIETLDAVIEDWVEVLTAHNEDFLTELKIGA
ncbi:hypothetical protein V1279_002990 [Bradyrhizobium sp. AZCC 1610]|uniref:hypothetical protein n=1 Tax=Bradyrhizobium sp. AZCC 1610 TaxID=3117020 RepID=UPI002FF1F28A